MKNAEEKILHPLSNGNKQVELRHESINVALAKARDALMINVTANQKWRLKQLHGLFNLLNEHWDDLSTGDQGEAGLIDTFWDVSQIINHQSRPITSSPILKKFQETVQPFGISLIVNEANTSKFISAIAASINAGNVVVITSIDNEKTPILTNFQQLVPQYLDAMGVSCTTPLASGSELPNGVNHLTIIGTLTVSHDRN